MNEKGSVGILLMLSLLIISVMGFGTWGVLRKWRHMVESQHRLDRCVGDASLELHSRLKKIQQLNRQITITRQTLVTTVVLPEARPVLQGLLELLVVKQDFERARWSARQIRWLAERGCLGASSFARPLPSFHLTRPPRDSFGPQALTWERAPSRFLIQAARLPRSSAAQIISNGGPDEPNKFTASFPTSFTASWTRPVGANFP